MIISCQLRLRKRRRLKSRPLQNRSVRDVFGIEPDADSVFVILYRDKFGVSLPGQSVKGCDEVQFIFASGEKGIDNLYGNLTFDFGLLGILFIEDMNDQMVALFGDANIAIVALNSDEFAVFGRANGFDEGAKVNVIDMGVIDLHLASVKPSLFDRWEEFLGQLEGGIEPDGFALGVRTNDADVQPTVLGCRNC